MNTFLKILSSAAMIAAAALAAFMLSRGAEETEAEKIPAIPMSVKASAVPLKKVSESLDISGNIMGKVMAVQVIPIRPKVSGILVKMGEHYGSGHTVEEGEEILYIEDVDYRAAYELALANLEKAKAALELEEGSQEVAEREWKIMTGENPEIVEKAAGGGSLARRVPHLKSAKAEVARCEALLKTAQNDLRHTVIKAPFPGLISYNQAGVGMMATPSTSFCTFSDTRYFWVDATVPYETIKWLDIPRWSTDKALGSKCKVYIDGGNGVFHAREGHVHRMRGELNAGDHMVRLMLKIDDPLALKEHKGKMPLLLDTNVAVEIEGKTVENVYKIGIEAWHKNSEIYTVNSEGRLKRMTPEVVWRGKEHVYISPNGIPEGTLLVTSPVAIPADGMRIEVVPENEL